MNQFGAPSALKPHRGTMLIIFGVLGIICCVIFGSNRSGPRPYPGYGPDRSDEPSQVVMSDGLRKPCSRAMLTLRR